MGLVLENFIELIKLFVNDDGIHCLCVYLACLQLVLKMSRLIDLISRGALRNCQYIAIKVS